MAGMRSGEMGDLLDRFSEYLRVGVELKRKLWLSLAYPVLTVGIALALFVLVCVFRGQPVRARSTETSTFRCRRPTRLLLALLAHGDSRMVVPLGIVAAVILCAVAGGSRCCLPRPQRRSLAARLPLLGAVWRSMSLAEFCHLLALLVDGRLPLAEAFG